MSQQATWKQKQMIPLITGSNTVPVMKQLKLVAMNIRIGKILSGIHEPAIFPTS